MTWLRPAQVADMIGRKPRTLEQWRYVSTRDNRLIGPQWTKVYGRILYDRATVENWIRSHQDD